MPFEASIVTAPGATSSRWLGVVIRHLTTMHRFEPRTEPITEPSPPVTVPMLPDTSGACPNVGSAEVAGSSILARSTSDATTSRIGLSGVDGVSESESARDDLMSDHSDKLAGGVRVCSDQFADEAAGGGQVHRPNAPRPRSSSIGCVRRTPMSSAEQRPG